MRGKSLLDILVMMADIDDRMRRVWHQTSNLSATAGLSADDRAQLLAAMDKVSAEAARLRACLEEGTA